MVAIVQTKDILGGKPRIKGTRVSIDVIGGYIACGYGVKEIQRDYPHLKKDEILAALKYLEDKSAEGRESLESESK